MPIRATAVHVEAGANSGVPPASPLPLRTREAKKKRTCRRFLPYDFTPVLLILQVALK